MNVCNMFWQIPKLAWDANKNCKIPILLQNAWFLDAEWYLTVHHVNLKAASGIKLYKCHSARAALSEYPLKVSFKPVAGSCPGGEFSLCEFSIRTPTRCIKVLCKWARVVWVSISPWQWCVFFSCKLVSTFSSRVAYKFSSLVAHGVCCRWLFTTYSNPL